jgi:hypothetical protein
MHIGVTLLPPRPALKHLHFEGFLRGSDITSGRVKSVIINIGHMSCGGFE